MPTGHGFVEIAHGRCSIPAPATGELLRGVPLAPLDVEGELTTPTGAAIVAALADDFGPLPAMTVERIGYGAGQKDFPQPNILRLLVGEARFGGERANRKRRTCARTPNRSSCSKPISTTPPAKRSATPSNRLWAAGALDVSLTPIQMKKGRPGVLLSVQARPADADTLEAILFAETPTLGVRRYDRTAYRARARGTNGRNPLGTGRRQSRISARRLAAVHAGVRSVPRSRRATTTCRWPT